MTSRSSRNWKHGAEHYRDKPSPECVVFWSIVGGFVAGFAGSWIGYWFG